MGIFFNFVGKYGFQINFVFLYFFCNCVLVRPMQFWCAVYRQYEINCWSNPAAPALAMKSKCHSAAGMPFRAVSVMQGAYICKYIWCGGALAGRQVGAHGADKYSLNAHLAAPAAIKACGLRSKFNFSRPKPPGLPSVVHISHSIRYARRWEMGMRARDGWRETPPAKVTGTSQEIPTLPYINTQIHQSALIPCTVMQFWCSIRMRVLRKLSNLYV